MGRACTSFLRYADRFDLAFAAFGAARRTGFRSATTDWTFAAGLRGEARAQRRHEIDDVGADEVRGRSRAVRDDLPALDLPLHGRQDALLFLVDECAGVVAVGGDLLDDLLGQRQFGIAHRHQLDLQGLDGSHLVGIQQLLENQTIFGRANLDDVFLGSPGPFRQRAPVGVLHGPHEQAVRLGAALVRSQEVRLVEVERVDRVGRDKGHDVDRLPRRFAPAP